MGARLLASSAGFADSNSPPPSERGNILNRRHRISLGAIALAFAMAMVIPPSTASANETVQFASFAVKTFLISGQPAGSRPVTMFIDVANKRYADYVCAVAPRIRDAVLVELTREPLYLTPEGEMPVQQLAERLKPVISKAIEHDLILNLGIVDGTVKMAVGVAAKLPSAQTGCARVSR